MEHVSTSVIMQTDRERRENVSGLWIFFFFSMRKSGERTYSQSKYVEEIIPGQYQVLDMERQHRPHSP